MNRINSAPIVSNFKQQRCSLRFFSYLSTWQTDERFEHLFALVHDPQIIRCKALGTSEEFAATYDTAMQQMVAWREYRLSAPLEAAMASLERAEMQAIYAECRRLGFESPHLKEIESHVGLSEGELLKRQYAKVRFCQQLHFCFYFSTVLTTAHSLSAFLSSSSLSC